MKWASSKRFFASCQVDTAANFSFTTLATDFFAVSRSMVHQALDRLQPTNREDEHGDEGTSQDHQRARPPL
jgi:hypothetical protein